VINHDLSLRADARRNRERIVEAARLVLAESGLDAPIDDIAQRAGVGVGTIYRRFGDREALVRAVALDSIESLAASAENAADQRQDLARFITSAFEIRLGALAVVLLPVMSTALGADREFRQLRRRLFTAVETLLAEVRTDVSPADLLIAIAKITHPLPGVPIEFDTRQSHRMAAILLDGLRTPTPSELPGKAPTPSTLNRALRNAESVLGPD
jgi:AcrR family transcriptional regulator